MAECLIGCHYGLRCKAIRRRRKRISAYQRLTLQGMSQLTSYHGFAVRQAVRHPAKKLPVLCIQSRQVQFWKLNLLYEFRLMIGIGFFSVVITCEFALAPGSQGLQCIGRSIYAAQCISPTMTKAIERLARLHLDRAWKISLPKAFQRVTRMISIL